MQVEIVIPARLASTRLPEKLLLSETGQPLIAHTYQAARKSKLARGVTLAVDHLRLAQAADAIGASWVMTDPNAQSGTDRISEVARNRPDVDAFVNVQGDEPEIPGEAIDQVIGLLIAHPECSVATLATPIRKKDDLEDPACVKVVCNHRGEALYFSRSVVPHPRQWDDGLLLENPPLYLQHLGIYAYRRDFLMSLGELPESPLERTEKLEQLRFLQAGHRIVVGTVPSATRGIDTRADYDAFLGRHRSRE